MSKGDSDEPQVAGSSSIVTRSSILPLALASFAVVVSLYNAEVAPSASDFVSQSDYDSTISTLQGQTTKIAVLEGHLNSRISSDITAVQTDVAGIHTTIAGLPTDAKMTAMTADVTSLQTDLANMQSQVAGLSTSADVVAAVAPLATASAVTALQTDVTTLQSKVDKLPTDANVAAAVSSLAGNAVSAELTLDIDISSIVEGSDARAQFEADFKAGPCISAVSL